MQIESLKTFCDLAESESFTKAAQINSVTQSAVSQTITAMEKQFKSLLIERSKKNFRLTSEGQVVYDYAKRLLQSYDAIQSKMQELKNEISGRIRIATVYSIGLYDLPGYVKTFLKNYPEVNLHVQYRRSNQVYDDVIGNIADLGLVAYPGRDSRLEIVHLRGDPLVLICHPQNPLAKLKSIKLKALEGQKFISFDPDMPTRKKLDKMFKDQGTSVEHVMHLDNIETLKRVVEMGSGVAIVPEETVRLEVASQALAAVKVEGNHRRELGVIYTKRKVLSPAMKKFINLLQETP
jgi:LysR family transcriptional regulator, transcriptional activator of the cysJI operon